MYVDNRSRSFSSAEATALKQTHRNSLRTIERVSVIGLRFRASNEAWGLRSLVYDSHAVDEGSSKSEGCPQSEAEP